jgi:hypothetical protein
MIRYDASRLFCARVAFWSTLLLFLYSSLHSPVSVPSILLQCSFHPSSVFLPSFFSVPSILLQCSSSIVRCRCRRIVSHEVSLAKSQPKGKEQGDHGPLIYSRATKLSSFTETGAECLSTLALHLLDPHPHTLAIQTNRMPA